MANNRIFYAIQALGIKASGDANPTWMKGVQSVGITTNFNLEQVFELGQLAVYQQVENIPEIEVTAEKVIDGHPLLYTKSCPSHGQDIVKASNDIADLYLVIYPDTNTSASGTGTAAGAVGYVYCSGMRPSNVSYTFPVEGNSTESVTFVGNDKSWQSTPTGINAAYPGIADTGNYHNPNSGVFRRQHFVPHGTYASTGTYVPSEVRDATSDGNGRIQNISASVDFGRENIFELGTFRPYVKFTSFPVTTSCEFEVISTKGDYKNATSDNATNTSDQSISLQFNNGVSTLNIDLGTKNRLQSVNYTGGDTGGGNASMTFSYQGFNYFVVTTGTVA